VAVSNTDARTAEKAVFLNRNVDTLKLRKNRYYQPTMNAQVCEEYNALLVSVVPLWLPG
jgi:hypothetical protein